MRASFLAMMETTNPKRISRRQLRQHVFSLVYSLEFYDDADFPVLAERYLDDNGIQDQQDREFISQEALSVMKMREKIDQMIDQKSAHWKSRRIARVDLAIIRLAVYEMLEDKDVPVSVAINEAVRLAKKYSSETAPAFVNGVLAALIPEQTEE